MTVIQVKSIHPNSLTIDLDHEEKEIQRNSVLMWYLF